MNKITKRILKLWYVTFLCLFFLFGGLIYGDWITKTMEIRIGEINLFGLIIVFIVLLTLIIFYDVLKDLAEFLAYPFGIKTKKKNKEN